VQTGSDLPAPEDKKPPPLLRLALWRWLVLIAFVSAYILFAIRLPAAPTISVVSAVTEQVSFTVQSPEMARLRLPAFSARTEISAAPVVRRAQPGAASAAGVQAQKALCPGGILEPSIGTRIIYRRIGEGPMRIILDRADDKPVGEFKGQAQPVPRELQRASWLVLEADGCDGTAAERFPIHGVAEVGDELRPETQITEPSSAPLIEGSVQVFGRTIDILSFGRDKRSRLYDVAELTIPPGSRVAEAPRPREGSATPARPSAPWSGFALLDDSALQVELTTEAKTLAIYRPGGGIEPEVLSVDLFAQLTNDPNIIWLQAAGASLLIVVQMLFFALGGRRRSPYAAT
jgi:hypothetical protein